MQVNEQRIEAVWESPANEVTEYYCWGKGKGERRWDPATGDGWNWYVGDIIITDDQRVLVHDQEGNLRVSLPLASTAVEYMP
jgi:hypothetical protein